MLLGARIEGRSRLLGVVRDYYQLTKPTIVMLMLVTGLPALLMTGRLPDLATGLIALVGTWLAASSASAINHYIDRHIDAVMDRTRRRPIPGARVTPEQALVFGIVLGAFSVLLLGLFANWVAAAVALASILFYTVIYTWWLKPRTPQNIVIGGAAGATAPLIVWAAVSGELGLAAWLMFAIIFMWTPPHFWALALFRKEDYARAKIPMMPVVAGEDSTRKQMLIYTLLLIPTTLSLVWVGASSWLYLVGALVLNGIFTWQAVKLFRTKDVQDSKRMFIFSNFYMMLLFVILFLDAVVTLVLGTLI
jgi:protoheme IX farnesyltransferase